MPYECENMEINFEKYLEGKKILITGGAGFIGSNLVKRLLQYDVEKIIIVDNLSSGSTWLLPESDKIKLYIGSILNNEVLRRAFSEKPNIVYHLAAHFANQNSIDHPETDLLVNGLGTLKVFEYSHIAGVKRVVFAGSGCSVYGHKAPLPYREDMPPTLHYDTPYQIHKLLGELYAYWMHDYYGLPITVVRYFNVYGPGEVPGKYRNVIPNFIYWAMKGKPLPITGTGEETRDFTYVEDAVDATLRATIVKEAIGEAFNIASGKEIKIIELAKMINELTGNPSGVIFKPRRDWDRSIRRRASIEKAKKILGYEPKVEFKEGLKRTVQWFKENWELIEKYARF